MYFSESDDFARPDDQWGRGPLQSEMKIEPDLRLRHPNHFVLEGTNNRNVIITYRFLAAPVQGNRDFFWHTDSICQESVSTFLNIHVSN